MIEAGLVFGLVALLAGLGAAANLVPPFTLLATGAVMVALGFAGGGAAGAYYHLLLYRALREQGPLPKGWYWNPVSHHANVSREARRAFRPWFVIGALGFGLIILGIIVVGMASMVLL